MASADTMRFLRWTMVVRGIFPKLMQDLIARKNIPPKALYRIIWNSKALMNNLNEAEVNSLEKLMTHGFAQLDTELIYKIIKYHKIGFVEPPTKLWGSDPKKEETRIGDDIERIRKSHNTLIHKADVHMSETEFEEFFITFIKVGSRIDMYLGKKIDDGYEKRIANYKTCSLEEMIKPGKIQARKEADWLDERRLNADDGCTFENADQSNLCFDVYNCESCPDRSSNITEVTDHHIACICEVPEEQFLSSSCNICNNHAKIFCKFCISHELPLCDDCKNEKLHVTCSVKSLESVARGVKFTDKFMDVDQRIHSLFQNTNNVLKELEKEILFISDDKKGFQKSIEECKKEFNFMIDSVKEEGLKNIESKRVEIHSFQNKISTLNLSVKKMKAVIGVWQMQYSDMELFLSLPRFEEYLKKCENELLLNLKERKTENIQPTITEKTLCDLTLKISHNPTERQHCRLSLFQELQQIANIKLHESFVFEIPVAKEANLITGCTIMEDGVMCFIDSKSRSLKIRTTDGKFKAYLLFSIPLDITAISISEVAILHKTSIVIYNVCKKQAESFQFERAGKFRLITFDNQNLVICVSGCSFLVINLQGQMLKEINIDETLISCISCWNNTLFYANRDKNNIYSVNLSTGESILIMHVSGIVDSPTRLASDGYGNVFVVGDKNNNIVAISVYGKEYKKLVQGLGTIHYPKAIAYSATQRQLLICSPIGLSAVYANV